MEMHKMMLGEGLACGSEGFSWHSLASGREWPGRSAWPREAEAWGSESRLARPLKVPMRHASYLASPHVCSWIRRSRGPLWTVRDMRGGAIRACIG